MKHFGDPCIHCGIPHDDVPSGPCSGNQSKAKVLAYCVDRQAWQNPGSGAQTVLCMMTSGEIRHQAWHPSETFEMNDYLKDAEVLARHKFRERYKYTSP